MIKILIADDSPTDTAILTSLFEAEPDMSVVACARDGKEAIYMVEKYKPDLVTMDIKMPKMDGYAAIDIIMSTMPTPIVVISSMINDAESDATFRALEAGALTVLPKPINIQSSQFLAVRRFMIDTIRSMSQIQVIRKRRIGHKVPTDPLVPVADINYHLVAIGSSIGGPQVLKDILSKLPSSFPIPIVAVQHMTHGFIAGFTKWLDSHVGLKVKYAEQGEILLPGVVYFAPDHYHLEVNKINNNYIVSLVHGEPVSGFYPSISVLMNSVAKHCGRNALGVLLTGMGSDGAEGLLVMKQGGAHTIIQDPASCVVFGMAGVAQAMGAVDKVVDLDKMAEYMIRVTNRKKSDK